MRDCAINIASRVPSPLVAKSNKPCVTKKTHRAEAADFRAITMVAVTV